MEVTIRPTLGTISLGYCSWRSCSRAAGILTGGPNGWRTFCLSREQAPSFPKAWLVSPPLDYLQDNPQSGCEPSDLTCPSTCSGGSLASELLDPRSPGNSLRPHWLVPRARTVVFPALPFGTMKHHCLEIKQDDKERSLSGSLQILSERWTLWLLSVLLEVRHTKPVWRREVPEGLISSTTSSSCQAQKGFSGVSDVTYVLTVLCCRLVHHRLLMG